MLCLQLSIVMAGVIFPVNVTKIGTVSMEDHTET